MFNTNAQDDENMLRQMRTLYIQSNKLLRTFHYCSTVVILKLFNPIGFGGGGALNAPLLRFFALTHLIFELHYCALGTFPRNSLTPCGKKLLIGGHDLALRRVSKYKVHMIFIIFREFNTMLKIVDA